MSPLNPPHARNMEEAKKYVPNTVIFALRTSLHADAAGLIDGIRLRRLRAADD